MLDTIRVVYDDREKFPWLVWVGTYLWTKCRTRKNALWQAERLQRAFSAYQQFK